VRVHAGLGFNRHWFFGDCAIGLGAMHASAGGSKFRPYLVNPSQLTQQSFPDIFTLSFSACHATYVRRIYVQALRDSGIQAEMQSMPAQFHLSIAMPIMTVRVTVLALFCHLFPSTPRISLLVLPQNEKRQDAPWFSLGHKSDKSPIGSRLV
jgi:hypothetical protein